jgi:hypothetical protein
VVNWRRFRTREPVEGSDTGTKRVREGARGAYVLGSLPELRALRGKGPFYGTKRGTISRSTTGRARGHSPTSVPDSEISDSEGP